MIFIYTEKKTFRTDYEAEDGRLWDEELEEGYVYVVIEIKTDKEPVIYENLKALREAKANWHWPFTGNGFTANREGEIIPEYYLKWYPENRDTKEGKFPNDVEIRESIIIDNGVAHKVGW